MHAGLVKWFPADADSAGLWTVVSHFFHEGDFGIDVNFIEAAVENSVAVEVNAATFRRFQESVVFEREQFGDNSVRFRHMCLDVTTHFPGVVFQPSADGTEGISDGHVSIFVGVILFRVSVHYELFAGDFKSDHDFKDSSLASVAVGKCKRDMAAGDAIAIAFQCLHMLADIGFHRVGPFETSKCDFQRNLHDTAFGQ